MINAAAEVNPLMTGCDKKFTRNPARNTPMKSCNTPTMSARTMAAAMKASLPGSAIAPTPETTSNDTIATGPTAS